MEYCKRASIYVGEKNDKNLYYWWHQFDATYFIRRRVAFPNPAGNCGRVVPRASVVVTWHWAKRHFTVPERNQKGKKKEAMSRNKSRDDAF